MLAAKLIDDLAERIQSKILNGEYPAGSRLKQEVLAAEFAVSRTPIREALSRLEAMGLISQEQRRSAIVRSPSGREVMEMYQVRAELEGLAASLAAKRISDQQLSTLRLSHDEFVEAVEALRSKAVSVDRAARGKPVADGLWNDAAQRWVALNAAFHSTIGEASANAYLQATIQSVAMSYTRTLLRSSSRGLTGSRVAANISWHERILRSLEGREPDKARRAMTEHILEAGEIVGALFERRKRG